MTGAINFRAICAAVKRTPNKFVADTAADTFHSAVSRSVRGDITSNDFRGVNGGKLQPKSVIADNFCPQNCRIISFRIGRNFYPPGISIFNVAVNHTESPWTSNIKLHISRRIKLAILKMNVPQRYRTDFCLENTSRGIIRAVGGKKYPFTKKSRHGTDDIFCELKHIFIDAVSEIDLCSQPPLSLKMNITFYLNSIPQIKRTFQKHNLPVFMGSGRDLIDCRLNFNIVIYTVTLIIRYFLIFRCR